MLPKLKDLANSKQTELEKYQNNRPDLNIFGNLSLKSTIPFWPDTEFVSYLNISVTILGVGSEIYMK